MKSKLIAVVLSCFCGIVVFGQSDESRSSRVNEVKVNFLNIITLSSVEVGYERFFGNDQSVGFDLYINDRFSYFPEKGIKNKAFNTTSLGLSYNFYFSESKPGSGYYITPFFKYRFGNYTETRTDFFGLPTPYKIGIDSPILGLGMGYKLVFAEKLTVSANASIARNFNRNLEIDFWTIEPNASINVGYRF